MTNPLRTKTDEDSILSCGLDDLRHSPGSSRDSSVCDADSRTALDISHVLRLWGRHNKIRHRGVFGLFGCWRRELCSKFYIIASLQTAGTSSGFSTHIDHLPPSVSSPRSQWRWSNDPLPFPRGTESFRIRRASAPCPSPLVPRLQVRARNGDEIITPCHYLGYRGFSHRLSICTVSSPLVLSLPKIF
jgi:hypothetical protein